MNIRPNYKSSAGNNIAPIIILFLFLSVSAISIIKFSTLVAPLAIFLGALYVRISIQKAIAGAGVSLLTSFIFLFLNDLARLDCSNNCDAETETSIGIIFIFFLIINLILFLIMMRAKSKQSS